MSRYELTRWSGLAGIVSGLLIIAGAVALQFTEPVVSGALFVSGHILLFFLFTGVYGITYSHTGTIGFLGYTLSTIGNALIIMIQTASSFSVVDTGDMFPAAETTAGIILTAGLLFIAIAITRIRALPAWPGWFMFAGIALNLILPQILSDPPEIVVSLPPILLGFGAASFGWALRRN